MAGSQTLGGRSVFNFLQQAGSPQLAALGGINISQINKDPALAFTNPALLRPEMHLEQSVSFNQLTGAFHNYQLLSVYHLKSTATTVALGINYFDYGNSVQTDAAGNQLGNFRPNDYQVQLSAARNYSGRWQYGMTIRFIHSSYGVYRSSGLAADLGLTYTDSARLTQAALVIRNMGIQVKPYAGTERGDLPFDLQVGISRKLRHAPIQFSITAHQAHRFNIKYADSAFDNEIGYSSSGGFVDKVFRHFIFSAQFFIADKVELSAGYNYLRRKELNTGNAGNGLNGFSMGVAVVIKKFQIRYARTYYQNNLVNNQVGFGFALTGLSSIQK